MTIERRKLTPRDVKVEIRYCGICHSDLHYARNEWADVMADHLPVCAGARDHRPRRRSGLGSVPVQGRGRRGRRLSRGFGQDVPELP